MISIELVFGLFLIAGAYGILWYCVLRANRTIEIINSSQNSSYPEILSELQNRGEDSENRS